MAAWSFPAARQNSGMRIGIDLGGTKTEAVLMGPGSAILARERLPTPH